MKANILIVDDVSTNLAILSDIVRNAGHIAIPVQSVREAEAILLETLPDIILSDISMPDIDGYEFCDRLKANPKTAEIPVMFISAMSDTDSKKRGYHAGVMDFISKPFDSTEVKLRIDRQLETRAIQNELADYNKRLHKMVYDHIAKITDDERYLIYSLVRLAESREDPTGTHMLHVSVNAQQLAQALRLSQKFEKQITNNFIEDIKLAAPLHDIGNMAISDRILLKSGKLTADEMALVKTHTEVGARTLMEVYSRNEYSRYLGMAIDIAFYHHERWDGMGYPKGFKGRAIPIAARIFSVVDSYDTLTRDKSYRDAFSHEEAIEIIKSEAGSKFDPEIVDIFLKVQDKMMRNQ